jgi:hypothetical protein
MYGYFISEPRSKMEIKFLMRDVRRGQKVEHLKARLLKIFILRDRVSGNEQIIG